MKRIAIWFTTMFLIFVMVGTVGASGEIFSGIIYVNPTYEECVGADVVQADISSDDTVAEPNEYYTDLAEVGIALREGLVARENVITIGYRSSTSLEAFEQIFDKIHEEALEHTEEATEGDYLRWHIGQISYSCSGSFNGTNYYYTFTFSPTYYTTLEQEQAMDTQVELVLAQLALEGKAPFDKIKSIYEYICKNVDYDYTNLYNQDYVLKYTAYAALVNKTAVCQGYATLFYRLALASGLDARVVTGISNNENHAWNIVKLGDVYYNLDSTWDEGEDVKRYFLKCEEKFATDHSRDPEMSTTEYFTQYPMAEEDFLPYLEGSFGENLKWRLDEEGTLTILGTGAMPDYGQWEDGGFSYQGSPRPWDYYGTVRKVIIEEGVTKIGNAAFVKSTSLEEVRLPATPVTFGDYCFANCSSLDILYSKGDAPSLNGTVFYKIEPSNITFYYLEGKQNWTTPEWNSFNAYPYIPVEGISLTAGTLSLFTEKTASLQPTVTPLNASVQTVLWSSDNPDVADVNAAGTITAKAVGEAVITAKTRDGGYTAQCTVTVWKAGDLTRDGNVDLLDVRKLISSDPSLATYPGTLTPADARLLLGYTLLPELYHVP